MEISNFLQLVSISDRLAHFTKNRVKMYDLRKKLQGIQSPLTAKFCAQLSQETGCSFWGFMSEKFLTEDQVEELINFDMMEDQTIFDLIEEGEKFDLQKYIDSDFDY